MQHLCQACQGDRVEHPQLRRQLPLLHHLCPMLLPPRLLLLVHAPRCLHVQNQQAPHRGVAAGCQPLVQGLAQQGE